MFIFSWSRFYDGCVHCFVLFIKFVSCLRGLSYLVMMFRSGEIYHLKTFLEANVYVPQHSLPLTEVDVAWFWML